MPGCCPSAFTLSNHGYIKRMPVDTYRTQSRGGRGVNAQNLKEEDYVKSLNIASTHDYILFFTDMGKVHLRKGYQIPEAGRTARGTAIVNVLPLDAGENVTAMVVTREFNDNEFLLMATQKGVVKRLPFITLKTNRKGGIRALTLDEDDHPSTSCGPMAATISFWPPPRAWPSASTSRMCAAWAEMPPVSGASA